MAKEVYAVFDVNNTLVTVCTDVSIADKYITQLKGYCVPVPLDANKTYSFAIEVTSDEEVTCDDVYAMLENQGKAWLHGSSYDVRKAQF